MTNLYSFSNYCPAAIKGGFCFLSVANTASFTNSIPMEGAFQLLLYSSSIHTHIQSVNFTKWTECSSQEDVVVLCHLYLETQKKVYCSTSTISYFCFIFDFFFIFLKTTKWIRRKHNTLSDFSHLMLIEVDNNWIEPLYYLASYSANS